MGLPRWLTAVTLSLGVVFIIWLCLVIPQVVGNWTRDLWTEMNKDEHASFLLLQNAPRQRIRLTANAKEIEAMQGAKVGGEYERI